MPNIKVQPSGNVYEYEVGKTLLEVLLEEGIFVDNPCNGKGLCGKCKVRILEGELSEPEDTERKLLKQEEMENGVRLSCLVKPETDLEIELMQKERKHQVLTGGSLLLRSIRISKKLWWKSKNQLWKIKHLLRIRF